MKTSSPRILSLPVVFALGVGCVVLGAVVGVMIGRRAPSNAGASSDGRSARSRQPQAATHGNIDPAGPEILPDDPAELKRLLLAARAQISALNNDLNRVGKVEESSSPAQRRAFAERLYTDYLAALQDKSDPEAMLAALAKIADLDESLAGYFIEQYEAVKGKASSGTERELALTLALLCGGQQAASFLDRCLNDPSMHASERANLLATISGVDHGLFSMRRIPVNKELAEIGFRYAESQQREERMAAAGLLGAMETEESRITLRTMIDRDSSAEVRAAAIRSLGHVGDASTMAYLKTYLYTYTVSPREANGHLSR